MQLFTCSLRRRVLVCILVSIGYGVLVSLSVNMNIAIVPMTTNHTIKFGNGTLKQVIEHDWDSVTRGYILSSFYYGGMLAGLFGGVLGSYIGGSVGYGLGIFCSCIINIITPIGTNYGIYLILVLRTLSGFCLGASVPCMHTIFSKWSPPDERSRMVSFATVGADMGNIICFSLYGVIAHYWGWTILFYMPGVLGLLWCCIWFTMVKENPSDDPKISETELRYLQSCLGMKLEKRRVIPWKSMMTSIPIWALTISVFCNSWGFYTVYIELPMFLRDVFHFGVKEIGYAAFLPYIFLTISTVIAGIGSDYLVTEKGFSITTTRKLLACTNFVFAGISVIVIAFSNSIVLVILMLSLLLTCQGMFNASLLVNALDIAPNFAGIIFGIAFTFGAFPSFMVPTVTGYIVTNQGRLQWRWVFLICCMIHSVGFIVYLFYGQGKEQQWAIDKEQIIDSKIQNQIDTTLKTEINNATDETSRF